MQYPKSFDVIVVGGGHAGTEAALASARMGCETLLLTHNLETLGQMSCNPSIGGIGKGHLVKEIDALGGAMAAATDEAGIQFRILNGSKGPAVRATRAQADRVLYRAAIRRRLEQQPNLWLFQQAVDDLILEGDRVVGAVTQVGIRFHGRAVVLTAGTFLDGRIHVGLEQHSAGRAGDPPAVRLSQRLKELKLPQGRLKTGTPPRLDGRTIDFSRLVEQPGDGMPGPDGSPAASPMPVFSFLGAAAQHPRQLPCWITHTNERTHEIIRSGFDRSPMFTGVIGGIGPRYCPSIEDKVNRFADKGSHQVFLEPEGLTTHEFYPNGISTSLPFDIQLAAVRSMVGLEAAHIVRPGYAIEYDYFDPRELGSSFETRGLQGLYFAGQINGTTGYEEAAAQGLHAGLNAALQVRGEAPWVPRRDEAYLGVLVDDLITKGVTEPYRMFTSRAEYRLQLREDNADLRLTEAGRRLGLVDDRRWDAFCRKRDAIEAELARLKATWLHPGRVPAGAAEALLGTSMEREYRLSDLLRRPGVGFDQVASLAAVARPEDAVSRETLHGRLGAALADSVIEQVEVQIRYAGYIDKQHDEVARSAHLEHLRLPPDLDYGQVHALSFEVRQKLSQHRPETLGQASRLSGVTPAAISLLLIHLRKGEWRALAAPAEAGVVKPPPMPHPELAGVLEEGAAALGCELGDTQLRRLLAFLDLLEKWNAVYNLTSIRVPAQMVPLHLLDSLAIIGPWRRHLASVKTEPSTRWLDVGSGGGLPGVVMAILEPSLEITCVDAVGKKARFVRQVAAELGLSRLLAVHARVETMQGPRFDGITARAFATLDDLVRLTADRLVPNGVWLAMKGQRPEAEIRDVAARADVFHVEPLRVPGLNAERCLVWMRPRLVS